MKGMLVFKVVFTAIGSIFLVVAALSYNYSQNFMNNAEVAEGIVINGGRRATISFIDNENKEITYSPNLECNPPCYDLNEKVKVYYNKKDHNDVMVSGFASQYLLVAIFGGIGLVFFSIGFGFIIIPILRKNKNEELKRLGMDIQTEFVEVAKNRSLKVNGKSPYQIHSQWLDADNNKMYLFKSENLWFNPQQYVNPEDKILVYVDRNNYKKYYMDISFLPEIS